MKRIATLMAVGLLATTTHGLFAQEAAGQNTAPEGNGQETGMNGGPMEMGPGMEGGPGMHGPGMHGRGMGGFDHPPMPRPTQSQYDLLRSYIDTVNALARLAGDPKSAAVAAVVSASDMLRQKGPAAAIDYLSKMLPKAPDPDVKRAIRLQLIDLYRQSGQSDKALEQMDALITGASPTTEPSK